MARAWHAKTLAYISTSSPPVTVANAANTGNAPFATVATSGNASDLSGTLPPATLPNPSASTLGGVESYAPVSHQWINTISTSGVPSSTQPAFSDISGSVAAAQLPNPSASTLGGVQSIAAVSHNFLTSISTSGVPAQAQPAFGDISGSVAASQLPNPSSSTLGGVQSYASVSHQWINSISTSGVPSSTQPTTADLSQSQGTFTPTLTFATPGDVSVSYTNQNGNYYILGNLCFYKIKILTSSFTHTTSSGDLNINGLPFTVKSTATNARGLGYGIVQGITKAGYTQFTSIAKETTTTLIIVGSGSGVAPSNVGSSDMPTAGTVQIEYSGFYEMA